MSEFSRQHRDDKEYKPSVCNEPLADAELLLDASAVQAFPARPFHISCGTILVA